MTGNLLMGGFNITNVSINAGDNNRDLASDCPVDNYVYAWGNNQSVWFCRLDKTNSTDDIRRAMNGTSVNFSSVTAQTLDVAFKSTCNVWVSTVPVTSKV